MARHPGPSIWAILDDWDSGLADLLSTAPITYALTQTCQSSYQPLPTTQTINQHKP